jgi:hypothetical protein
MVKPRAVSRALTIAIIDTARIALRQERSVVIPFFAVFGKVQTDGFDLLTHT